MQIIVDDELRGIAREIVAANRSLTELRDTESCDEFQTEHYAGGFEALEDAFCFSFYGPAGELWFQLTAEDAVAIAEGRLGVLPGRAPG